MDIECRHCGAIVEVGEGLGTRARCPACSEEMILPPDSVRPGKSLGDFELVSHLGSGAMGHVFLAEQKSLSRKVAVKAFCREYAPDSESLERFLTEMRLVAALDHPNIVTAFAAGEEDGVCYLAMSCVEGDDLEQILRKDDVLPEARVLAIGRKIGEALRYAWDAKKLLHRDIKPSNIKLTTAGQPMLLDLGIAKSTSEDASLTATGMVVGTPYYMSPEQARGEDDIDCRCDIYSLGATLYHLGAGGPPYDGKSTMSILTKHLTEPLPDPRKRNPSLSRSFSALVALMMAKERHDRPDDWQQLLDAIDLAAEGKLKTSKDWKKKLASQHLPWDTDANRAPGGRSKIAIAVGLAAVLVLAVGSTIVLRRRRAPAPIPETVQTPSPPSDNEPRPKYDLDPDGAPPPDEPGNDLPNLPLLDGTPPPPDAAPGGDDDPEPAGAAIRPGGLRGRIAKRINRRAALIFQQQVLQAAAAFRFDRAQELVAQGLQDKALETDRTRIEEVAEQLERVVAAYQLVIDSFKDQTGKEIELGLADGDRKVTIQQLATGYFECEYRETHLGAIRRKVRPQDLNEAERERRLAGAPLDAREVVQGLCRLAARDPEAASQRFSKAEGPLSYALNEIAKRRLAPAP